MAVNKADASGAVPSIEDQLAQCISRFNTSATEFWKNTILVDQEVCLDPSIKLSFLDEDQTIKLFRNGLKQVQEETKPLCTQTPSQSSTDSSLNLASRMAATNEAVKAQLAELVNDQQKLHEDAMKSINLLHFND